MTRYHLGGKDLRGALTAYAKRFDFLEIPLAGPNPPSAATLRKYRRSVPASFEFGVIAGEALATLRPGDAFEAELAKFLEAITILQARVALIRTPSEVTPAPLWRTRFEKLLERLPRDVTQVAWEPRGLWEIDDATVQAKKWGVVLVVDPAREAVPAGPVVYARLRALGETRSFGASALTRVADAIGERRDAYVVLETTGALKESKLFRQVAGEVAAASAGTASRVIQPRAHGSLKIRDDEQE